MKSKGLNGSGHDEKAKVRQVRQSTPAIDKRGIVLEALLAGKSQAAAARLAKISRRTVVRWLAAAEFADKLTLARTEAFTEALAALKGGAAPAVQTLLKILKSRRPSERRQAAKEILSFAFKGVELEDLEARLVKLEKYIEIQTAGLSGRVS